MATGTNFDGDRDIDRLQNEDAFGRDLVPYFLPGSDDINEKVNAKPPPMCGHGAQNGNGNNKGAHSNPKNKTKKIKNVPPKKASQNDKQRVEKVVTPKGGGPVRLYGQEQRPQPTQTVKRQPQQAATSGTARWAGDAFLNSPPPSSLPIPVFGFQPTTNASGSAAALCDPAIVSVTSSNKLQTMEPHIYGPPVKTAPAQQGYSAPQAPQYAPAPHYAAPASQYAPSPQYAPSQTYAPPVYPPAPTQAAPVSGYPPPPYPTQYQPPPSAAVAFPPMPQNATQASALTPPSGFPTPPPQPVTNGLLTPSAFLHAPPAPQQAGAAIAPPPLSDDAGAALLKQLLLR